MNVETKQGKTSVIELGDVFYSMASSTYYMLIKNLENRYYLHGLDGAHLVGNFYESIERARNQLQIKVDYSEYIHYQQSKYKLVLEEV
ncbi:hypothetical protein ABNX05_10960 [Lysinibacillus sp. M3]|uniref:Uncharacterized protein n=1 Tax=Lysinibacillus zambalensis TaxID=3160866 RepID=A0ABV1MRK4_9BACI